MDLRLVVYLSSGNHSSERMLYHAGDLKVVPLVEGLGVFYRAIKYCESGSKVAKMLVAVLMVLVVVNRLIRVQQLLVICPKQLGQNLVKS